MSNGKLAAPPAAPATRCLSLTPQNPSWADAKLHSVHRLCRSRPARAACCLGCLPSPQHVACRHQSASQARQLLPQALPLFAGEGAVVAAGNGNCCSNLVDAAVEQLAANGTHHPRLDL